MIWPTVAIAASIVALTAWLAAWYASRRLENTRRAEKHRNGFFDAAERVIADERTPAHLAAFVVGMSMGLSNRLLPYFLALWPTSRAPEEVRRSVRKVWKEMEALPGDLRQEIKALRFHGLMAIALQSTLVGSSLVKRIEATHRPKNRNHNRSDDEDALFDRAAAFQIKFPSKSPVNQLFAAP